VFAVFVKAGAVPLPLFSWWVLVAFAGVASLKLRRYYCSGSVLTASGRLLNGIREAVTTSARLLTASGRLLTTSARLLTASGRRVN
jgi:hypothetical protein